MFCDVLHGGQDIGYRVELVSVTMFDKLVPTPNSVRAQLGENQE